MKKTVYAAQYRRPGATDWKDIHNGISYTAEVKTLEEALRKAEWSMEAAKQSNKPAPAYRIVKREVTVEESVEVPEYRGR